MIRYVAILLLIIFKAHFIKAQTAENFTLVSTDGNVYTLFEQLDSNKIVILDFFSVGCQTCQLNTPEIDSLWQIYGYNGDSLWVWGIESFYANNQQIEDFKQQFGATFPCFSTKDDTTVLGLYNITYTPQYYIICPDYSSKKIHINQIESYILACKEEIVNYNPIKNKYHFTYSIVNNNLYIQNYEPFKITVTIYNILGYTITNKAIQPKSEESFIIPSSGIYIVKLNSTFENMHYSFKIVVK